MPRRRTPNELLAGFARFALSAYRVQDTPYHMVVRVQDTFGSWAAELRRLKESLHREIGAGMQFDVTWVDRIERAASGRFRYVISRVSAPAAMVADGRGTSAPRPFGAPCMINRNF